LQASVFGTRDLRLRADVRRLCRNLTRDFKPGVASVNIIFVTDRQIHALNRRFLRRDRPTDVISFNNDGPQLPGEPRLLGEVYISRDRARTQAREYGVSYASELRRLVLHGLLHLLGLTHAQMKPLYARYLRE
jgi:probable rRNA maturation factor